MWSIFNGYKFVILTWNISDVSRDFIELSLYFLSEMIKDPICRLGHRDSDVVVHRSGERVVDHHQECFR